MGVERRENMSGEKKCRATTSFTGVCTNSVRRRRQDRRKEDKGM